MTPEELMDKGRALLKLKADDYTSGLSDRYENFNRSSEVISWFKNDTDKVFVTLITTKLARLASLLDSKSPKNESIEDSFVDLINYCSLWGGKRLTISARSTIDDTFQCKLCGNLFAIRPIIAVVDEHKYFFCSISHKDQYLTDQYLTDQYTKGFQP